MAQAIENNLSGNFTISRNGWQADFPSAENFLWLFYGKDVPVSSKDKSYPNFMRYKNETFDQLYVSGLNAKSVEEGNQYFLQAEQVMMNDAPIIVLWYDEGYRLIQSYVKNFSNNPMQYRDLSQVYLGQDKDSYKDL
jgi:peptide/nickel transport system substrate-binding protein